MAAEIFRPDQWHDFFLMVGGGAAALTGLVFVAMSLNLDVITRDATHRHRAIGTLAGFTAGFVICSLALMGGQGHVAIGIEWFTVAGIAAAIYVNGYVQARRQGGSSRALRLDRTIAGALCYAAEMIGALMLALGYIAGLYIAAASLTILLAYMITGAWLLLIGVQRDRTGSGSGG